MERPLRDPVRPTELARLRPSGDLLQDRDLLLVGESALPHRVLPSDHRRTWTPEPMSRPGLRGGRQDGSLPGYADHRPETPCACLKLCLDRDRFSGCEHDLAGNRA